MKVPTDYEVWAAMARYGGSFARALAEAAAKADPDNLDKIKLTWPEMWQEYTSLAIMHRQREQARLNGPTEAA